MKTAIEAFMAASTLADLTMRLVREHLAKTFGEATVKGEKAYVKTVVTDYLATHGDQ
jgi:hypothetical protein